MIRSRSAALWLLASGAMLLGTTVATAETQPSDPPPGYYDDAEGLSGTALRAALHGIIDAHDRQTYDEIRGVIQNADAPAGSPNIVTVYSNLLIPGPDHGGWTREHAWPKSYGFPTDSRCNSAFSDAHHLFPETTSYNSSRKNGSYDNCPDHSDAALCVAKRADGFPDAVGNFRRSGSGEWEVWHDPAAAQGELPVGRRGDVARSMFYMDVRYEGGPNTVQGCDDESEPDLVLTSDLTLVVTTTVSPAYMGKLDTLLEWANEDPVDSFERRRNQIVYSYQQNRNPFVDRPEWIATVWAQQPTATATATATATPTSDQGGAPPTPTPTAPTSTPTWVSVLYLPHTSRLYWTYGPTLTPPASPTSLPPTATSTLPPPSPTATAPTATATHTVPPPTATATAPPTAIPPAQLVIGALQCETSNEYIRIDNLGGVAAQLSGWDIVSVVGPQSFTFPSYTLQPGGSVFVHSGPDAPPTGGNVIRWTGAYIWNNDGDTAELRDQAGTLVDEQDC